jgi:hypothetical protein
MKTHFCALLVVAALLAGTAGCKSSAADPQPNAPASDDAGEMTWTLGSAAASAKGQDHLNVVTSTSTTKGVTKRTLIMVGNQASSSSTLPGVRVSLDNITGPGTYPLLPEGDNSAAAWEAGGLSSPTYFSYQMPASATPVGQVVVTSYDSNTRRLKGTFSFTGRAMSSNGTLGATKAVTNGTFDVKILLAF